MYDAGDMPIVLEVDGPSLGGFVCPATIPSTQLWKMGQVSAKDVVYFKPMTLGTPPGSKLRVRKAEERGRTCGCKRDRQGEDRDRWAERWRAHVCVCVRERQRDR